MTTLYLKIDVLDNGTTNVVPFDPTAFSSVQSELQLEPSKPIIPLSEVQRIVAQTPRRRNERKTNKHMTKEMYDAAKVHLAVEHRSREEVAELIGTSLSSVERLIEGFYEEKFGDKI